MLGRGRWWTGAFALLLALTWSDASLAQEGPRYSLQGFGGWAYGKTDNDNFLGYSASPEGAWRNYYFALNVGARPIDKLSIRAQAFWGEDLRGKRTNLDYVFAEYAPLNSVRLRVGKVLVPFGLYSETYDVGTLRPFYLLPQFYVGTAGLIPKAYLGGGVTGAPPLGQKWELQYDVFGGEIEFEPFVFETAAGVDPTTGLPVFQSRSQQFAGKDMVGGRLLLVSTEFGVDFGGSIIHLGGVVLPEDSVLPEGSANLYNLRAQYQKGPFAVRAEFFKLAAQTQGDVDAFYSEASYRFLGKLQLAAQYEHIEIRIPVSTLTVPDAITQHTSFGLALNFWLSPEVVVKANGYTVHKNLAARPENFTLAALLGTIDKTTGALVLGAQFSF